MAAKKKKTRKKQDGRGRPISVDMEDPKIIKQVEEFGSCCATQKDMAYWFDVTVRTIENYMADKDGDFFRVYKKAQAIVLCSLRSKQLEKALAGDNTMLIWTGKQLLEQKEKQDITSDNEHLNSIRIDKDDDKL